MGILCPAPCGWPLQVLLLLTPDIPATLCGLENLEVYASNYIIEINCGKHKIKSLKDEVILDLKQKLEPIQVAGDGKFDSPGKRSHEVKNIEIGNYFLNLKICCSYSRFPGPLLYILCAVFE